MKRSSFVKSFIATAAAGTLSSCTQLLNRGAATGPTNWPGRKFHSARAFVYDCEAAEDYSFWQKDGTMHPGVLNAPGVPLTASHIQQLLQTVNTPTPKTRRIVCYLPHHAFVLYDSAENPVATLEVCFTCDRCKSTPEGIPSHFDIAPLWAILKELGVAAEATQGYYRQLYRAKCSRR